MKLIIGLGNPEPRYTATRHNVGWGYLDVLAAARGATFRDALKFNGQIAEFSWGGQKILLLKPTTYYNLSGESARSIINFYKITPTNTLVVHDDFAINFGTIRIRNKGSDGGNNGVKSIITHLGPHCWRLRIGILSDARTHLNDAVFVLSAFSPEEQTALHQTIYPGITPCIDAFLAGKLQPMSATLLH